MRWLTSVIGSGCRAGGSAGMKMSLIPTSSMGWLVLTSMMTFSACCRKVGELPTDVEGTIPPFSRMQTASTMATSILPRKP